MSMFGNDAMKHSSGRVLSVPLYAAIMIFFLLTSFPSALQAHPPKDVTLSYDAQKKILSVTITHPSFFPTKHYIKSVDISVNGKPAKDATYSEQPSSDTFTYTYPVDASQGDEISAVAKCNMFGSRDAVIKVPVR